jgi:hypothetical protein
LAQSASHGRVLHRRQLEPPWRRRLAGALHSGFDAEGTPGSSQGFQDTITRGGTFYDRSPTPSKLGRYEARKRITTLGRSPALLGQGMGGTGRNFSHGPQPALPKFGSLPSAWDHWRAAPVRRSASSPPNGGRWAATFGSLPSFSGFDAEGTTGSSQGLQAPITGGGIVYDPSAPSSGSGLASRPLPEPHRFHGPVRLAPVIPVAHLNLLLHHVLDQGSDGR